MILETERTILRPWEEKDAEVLYYHAKNPKIGPIANWPPHVSVEYSLNIIKTIFTRKETYAITLKNDIPIGCVSLLVYPDGNHYWGEGCGELGYWIGEEYWGKGFAVEASQRLLKRAFTELNLKKIYATYKEGNIQSKRVLEKLGFKTHGELMNIDYLGIKYLEKVMVMNFQ